MCSNDTAQDHILLAMESGVDLREEELGAVVIIRMLILWLSGEVVMDAAPSKLPKLTDHWNLHQLKLKNENGNTYLTWISVSKAILISTTSHTRR